MKYANNGPKWQDNDNLTFEIALTIRLGVVIEIEV